MIGEKTRWPIEVKTKMSISLNMLDIVNIKKIYERYHFITHCLLLTNPILKKLKF